MVRAAIKGLHALIEQEENPLPPAEAFMQDLTRVGDLLPSESNCPDEYAHCLRPSAMGRGCVREWWFKQKGVHGDGNGGGWDMNYGLRRICESGTDAHTRIQYVVERMQENGVDIEWIDPEAYVKKKKLKHLKVIMRHGGEVRFLDTRYDVTFMCDGVIKYKGVYYVFEIKTETSKKWFAHEDTREEHKLQSKMYNLGLGLHRTMFLYELRDWCAQKAFVYDIPAEELQELQMRLEMYREHMDTDTVPPEVEGIDCTGCDHKLACTRSAMS